MSPTSLFISIVALLNRFREQPSQNPSHLPLATNKKIRADSGLILQILSLSSSISNSSHWCKSRPKYSVTIRHLINLNVWSGHSRISWWNQWTDAVIADELGFPTFFRLDQFDLEFAFWLRFALFPVCVCVCVCVFLCVSPFLFDSLRFSWFRSVSLRVSLSLSLSLSLSVSSCLPLSFFPSLFAFYWCRPFRCLMPAFYNTWFYMI